MTSHFVLCRSYTCPRCGASSGQVCKQPSGKQAQYPHAERIHCLTSEELAQGQVTLKTPESEVVRLRQELERARAEVARLNRLLEAEDRDEAVREDEFRRLAHDHARAVAELDEARAAADTKRSDPRKDPILS